MVKSSEVRCRRTGKLITRTNWYAHAKVCGQCATRLAGPPKNQHDGIAKLLPESPALAARSSQSLSLDQHVDEEEKRPPTPRRSARIAQKRKAAEDDNEIGNRKTKACNFSLCVHDSYCSRIMMWFTAS